MRNRPLPSVAAAFVAAAAVLLCGVVGAAPAAAHAVLVSTDPSDGSSVSTAPRTVTLTFNENIGNPAYVVVTAPDGERVRTSDVEAIDDEVTAAVAASDQKGRYTMAYRVVSADGHPVSGTIAFTTTTGRTVTQVDQPRADDGSFVDRHRTHIVWGVAGGVVAIGLLLAPLRRRRADSTSQGDTRP